MERAGTHREHVRSKLSVGESCLMRIYIYANNRRRKGDEYTSSRAVSLSLCLSILTAAVSQRTQLHACVVRGARAAAGL